MPSNQHGVSASRRDFLAAAAAAAGTAVLSSSASAAPRTDLIPAIDTHQHLWDLKKL
ncbi:MAG: ubiquinol-cytochrome c reductase iron-sulfur subunit N-terminal domain-containing protein, partial [Planctomycetaceae bacterium]